MQYVFNVTRTSVNRKRYWITLTLVRLVLSPTLAIVILNNSEPVYDVGPPKWRVYGRGSNQFVNEDKVDYRLTVEM